MTRIGQESKRSFPKADSRLYKYKRKVKYNRNNVYTL